MESWHVNRLIDAPADLDRFQILTIPGGFSYGDDLGAGRILATRIRIAGRRPALDFTTGATGTWASAMASRSWCGVASARWATPASQRWPTTTPVDSRPAVRTLPCPGHSPFVSFTEPIELPVAHGEGKF